MDTGQSNTKIKEVNLKRPFEDVESYSSETISEVYSDPVIHSSSEVSNVHKCKRPKYCQEVEVISNVFSLKDLILEKLNLFQKNSNDDDDTSTSILEEKFIKGKPLSFLYQSYKCVLKLSENDDDPEKTKAIIELIIELTESYLKDIEASKQECLLATFIEQRESIKSCSSDVEFQEFVYLVFQLMKSKQDYFELRSSWTNILTASFLYVNNILFGSLFKQKVLLKVIAFLDCVCKIDQMLALIFFEFNILKGDRIEDIEQTLLGTILYFSSLPTFDGDEVNFDERLLDCKMRRALRKIYKRSVFKFTNSLLTFIESLVETSETIKYQVFNFFAQYIKAHEVRSKEWNLLNSDVIAHSNGFMLNLLSLLLKLFYKSFYSNIELVDITHIPSIQHKFENSGCSFFSQFQNDKRALEGPNDSTLLFYLTHRCISLTLVPIFKKLEELKITLHDPGINKIVIFGQIIKMESNFHRKDLIIDLIKFHNKTIEFILLSNFSNIPEFLIDNFANFFYMIHINVKYFILLCNFEKHVIFASKMIESRIVTNPNSRCKLIGIICMLLNESASLSKDDSIIISQLFNFFIEISSNEYNLPIATNCLFFNTRSLILSTIKRRKNDSSFMSVLESFDDDIGKADVLTSIPQILKFVHFFTGVLSEILDECMKIKEIYETFKFIEHMRDFQFYNNTLMQYCQMLHFFSYALPNSLLFNNTIDRLAKIISSSLNYFVYITDPIFKHFDFKPVFNIKLIFKSLYNLENVIQSDNLISLIAKSKFYSSTIFDKALKKIKQDECYSDLKTILSEIQTLNETNDLKENINDIPEEFLDSLLKTIMDDPVILPETSVRVDRSTIFRHLLENDTNPFNRQPLSMEMIKPDDDLRNKIVEWQKKKSSNVI